MIWFGCTTHNTVKVIQRKTRKMSLANRITNALNKGKKSAEIQTRV